LNTFGNPVCVQKIFEFSMKNEFMNPENKKKGEKYDKIGGK